MTDPQVNSVRAPVHAYSSNKNLSSQVRTRAAVLRAAAECCNGFEVMTDGFDADNYTFAVRCREKRYKSVLAACLRVRQLIANWTDDPTVPADLVIQLGKALDEG